MGLTALAVLTIGVSMTRKLRTNVRVAAVVFVTIFSLSSTMVPTSAIDLGAKAKYIISVNPAAKAAVEAAVIKAGGKVQSRYNYVFDGYTVELPKIVASLLSRIPNVLTVEEDRDVFGLAIQNTQSPTPAWGLDRVDQREKVGLPGSTSAYGYRSAGAGATIYIGDTGIYPHSDFAGRLSTSGYSSIGDGNGTVDCNGHGTHVAGTAAGTQYGLAKNARLVPVRILDCTGRGSYSGVMTGLDWILSPENPNSKTQAVLNLSIGGPASTALNAAILRLTNAGITVVAAAGNESTDACTKSPASAPSAITVGATNLTDIPASFSNQGKCVDIFAPGSSIVSAWIGTPEATYSASGTSMASPHVTGAAAIYLGLNPLASVAQVAQYLDAESTKDALTGLKAETVNKLLFVSPTDGGAPIVPPVVAQKSVVNITHQSADVLIDVNPGFAPTTLSFEYSASSSFVETATATVLPGMVEGGAPTTASVKLNGLNAATNYFFRIIGLNESGRTVSNIGSFTTLPPPVTAPIARVADATNVTAYSATLNGVVQAGNAATKATFVYGTDPEFKVNTNTIAANPFEISGGTNFFNVTLNVSYLDGGKKYYYKVVALNSSGTTHSPVMSFDTPVAPGVAPTVTNSAIPLSRSSATAAFETTVNPKGQTTTVEFVWGYEKSVTSAVTRVVIPASPITGETDVRLVANPKNLLPGRGIYYQFIARNASGMTKSVIYYAIISPETPVILNTYANANTTSGAVLNAMINPMGSNTNPFFVYGTDPLLLTGVTTTASVPVAITGAINNTVKLTLTGLQPATRYYFRSRIVPYTGPSIKQVILGPIQSFETMNAPTPTPTPVVPSPTPAPVVPGPDTQRPVVVSAATTPTTLEVCQTVRAISVTASDNIGIAIANLRITGPTGLTVYSTSMYRTAGTNLSGTWANDWAIPCTAAVGRYNVMVQVSDAAKNISPWFTAPSFLVQASTVMDKSAPVFVSGSISAGPFNVGQTIPELAARFTDDLGISTVTFIVTDPRGGTSARVPGYRNNGTKTDGIWRNDWAIPATALTGLYTIYVEAVDEWQKKNMRVLGTIDINPVPTSTPAPLPAPVAGDAAMVITPYFTTSTLRTGAITRATNVNLKVKSSGQFLASTLFASGQNSGLASLGHLLEATSLTPATCSVTGVATWDRTGGIFTRATVNALSAGTCSVSWRFLGAKGRAATSTIMYVTVNP